MDDDLLAAQVARLLADETDLIANAANVAAFIYSDSPGVARFSAAERVGIKRLVQTFLKSSERELMQ